MRRLLVLLAGILIGWGSLFYGYIRFQSLQTQQYNIQTQSTIVHELQSLARLTTVQMTVSKVIEAQKEFADLIPGFWLDDVITKALFDDALLMTVEAKVNAGIDLTKITTGNIMFVTDWTWWIDIILPAGEIFDVYLTEKTKPFERKLGILSKGNQELETKMRNDAISAIRKEALDKKIIATAQTNAQQIITDLIHKLWFQVRSLTFL